MDEPEGGMVEAGWKFLTAAITTALSALAGRYWWAVLLGIGLVLGMPLLLVWRLHTTSPPDVRVTFITPFVRYERGGGEKEPEAPKPKRWLRRKPPPDS